MFRGHRSAEQQEGVEESCDPRSKHLRVVWPPKGQCHPVQQEGSDDFRTNRKPGLFDGQPSDRSFFGRSDGFVSGDNIPPVITLHSAKMGLIYENHKPPKGEKNDEMEKHEPPCDRQRFST